MIFFKNKFFLFIALLQIFIGSHVYGVDYLDLLSNFNIATFGVHDIAEKIELEQPSARNSLAHSRMCRGDGVKEPPAFLLNGIQIAFQGDNRRYPSDCGFLHTRKIILDFLEKKFNIQNLTVDNICPCNGVSDGFAKTVACLLKKQDVVVSFVPTFGLHSRTVNSFGGRVYPIDVLNKPNFRPTIEELEEHVAKINEKYKKAYNLMKPKL